MNAVDMLSVPFGRLERKETSTKEEQCLAARSPSLPISVSLSTLQLSPSYDPCDGGHLCAGPSESVVLEYNLSLCPYDLV
jgi:hypothetical protein